MSENIDNLMLEHLKLFQATLSRVERKVDELILREGRQDQVIAASRRDNAHTEESLADHAVKLDQIDARLERVERRLELNG